MEKFELEVFKKPQEITFMTAKGLCRYDGKGLMQRVEYDVELSMKSGHFCALKIWTPNGDVTKHIMQAEGFEYLNKFANLQVVKEDHFKLNGIEYTNPHVEIDASGKKAKVYCKRTLMGPDNNGTIQFSSALVVHDTKDALITSILTKVKKLGDTFGFLTTIDGYQEERKKNASLVYYPIDDIMGVALNLKHTDAIGLYANYQNSKENIEKKVETVAKRNAFRKHPATSMYTLNPKKKLDKEGNPIDLVALVKVTTWVNIQSEEYANAVKNYFETGITETTIEKYVDSDPEVMEDENGLTGDEDFVVVDELELTEEEQSGIEETNDTKEKQNLINYIVEGSNILGGDVEKISNALGNMQERTITELQGAVSKIKKLDGKI
jgi:hypothetical protein